MNLNFLIKLVALAVLTLVCLMTFANAGGPWNDQYCNIETTQIKFVNEQGDVIENQTQEKITCNDGAKDFLHGMGIADSCTQFSWLMPLNGVLVEQKSIACHKLDGEYEIVDGYHYLN